MTARRTALVTGAAGGIGRAFVEALAEEGAELALIDVEARGLAATVATLVASATAAAPDTSGAKLRHAVADISDHAQLERAMDQLLPADRGLDLVVHCAAILGPGTWAAQAPEQFERVLHVNLIGTANVIRATLPSLRRARGHVVVLASTAALHGWPGLAAYSAAKFGVAGYCDAIRPELKSDGVGLTTVFPLLIDTPLLDRPDLPPILRQGRRIPAAAVVQKTLRAVARRSPRVYVPSTVRIVAALHGLAPSLLDWYGARFGLTRDFRGLRR